MCLIKLLYPSCHCHFFNKIYHLRYPQSSYILNNLKETRQVLGSLSSALFGYSPIFWRQASLHHHISTKVPDQCNYLSPAQGLPHNIPAQRAGRGKVRNKKIPQKLSPSAPCPHNIKQTLGPHQHHADISHLFLFNLP